MLSSLTAMSAPRPKSRAPVVVAASLRGRKIAIRLDESASAAMTNPSSPVGQSAPNAFTASGIPYKQAHRPRRIGLPSRSARRPGTARCRNCRRGSFILSSPSHHSITSSARARSVGGTVRPSAFAVLRFMSNSYFDSYSTGRVPGGVPRRILPT